MKVSKVGLNNFQVVITNYTLARKKYVQKNFVILKEGTLLTLQPAGVIKQPLEIILEVLIYVKKI